MQIVSTIVCCLEFWGLYRGWINETGCVIGGLLLVFFFLSSCVQRRNNKKLDTLTAKIKLAPRNLMPIISRKKSNDNVTLFLTPDCIQRLLSFPLYPPPPTSYLVLGVERIEENGWRKEEERRTHRVATKAATSGAKAGQNWEFDSKCLRENLRG